MCLLRPKPLHRQLKLLSSCSACLEVYMDKIDLAEQIGKRGFGMVCKGTQQAVVTA